MSWPNADTFGPRYDVIHPKTRKPTKVPDRGWRWNESTFHTQADYEHIIERYDGSYMCGGLWFAKDENTQPSSVKYLRDVSKMLLRSIVSLKSDGGIEVERIFDGKSYFSYPKPVSLLHLLIASVDEKNGIYMDFFSGSATTAHAVMQLNAEDGGHRKFIMVQLPEKCDEASEAYKAGYKNICEIGKERIRRAGEKIKSEIDVVHKDDYAALVQSQQSNDQKVMTGFDSLKSSGVLTEKGYTYKDKDTKDISRITYSAEDPNDFYRFHPNALDVGFRVLKLDDTNMKDVYYAPDDYDQGMLAGLESNIKDDRTDLDLLFGCLIDWGLPLSLPYKSEKIDGCTVHTYNDGDLIACFDANIPENVVKEIAQRRPLRAVFRDSGFASSPEKINVFEIFKLYMPEDAGDISKRVRVI